MREIVQRFAEEGYMIDPDALELIASHTPGRAGGGGDPGSLQVHSGGGGIGYPDLTPLEGGGGGRDGTLIAVPSGSEAVRLGSSESTNFFTNLLWGISSGAARPPRIRPAIAAAAPIEGLRPEDISPPLLLLGRFRSGRSDPP